MLYLKMVKAAYLRQDSFLDDQREGREEDDSSPTALDLYFQEAGARTSLDHNAHVEIAKRMEASREQAHQYPFRYALQVSYPFIYTLEQHLRQGRYFPPGILLTSYR